MWWRNNPTFVTRMAMPILLSVEATVCHAFLVPVLTDLVLYNWPAIRIFYKNKIMQNKYDQL